MPDDPRSTTGAIEEGNDSERNSGDVPGALIDGTTERSERNVGPGDGWRESLISRRSALRGLSTLGLGTIAIGSGRAQPTDGDRPNPKVSEGDSFKDRIRKSSPQELYQTYARRYGADVAKRVREVWKRYAQTALDDELTQNEATKEFFSEIKQLSPMLRRDIEAVQDHIERVQADPGTKRTVAAPSSGTTTSTQDSGTVRTQYSGELLRIDGAVGGSGIGFRDSHYYLDQDILTSIVMVTPAASIVQWAEFQGNFYISSGEGGSYRATADYWHNGMLVGGTAAYEMWIQPRGSSGRTFFTVRSPSASVFGNESRSVQMYLSDDTVYDFGFRLTTAINGIANALVDYQTVNANGTTRQLRLDSLTLNPI